VEFGPFQTDQSTFVLVGDVENIIIQFGKKIGSWGPCGRHKGHLLNPPSSPSKA
jgi:hypothetical protein